MSGLGLGLAYDCKYAFWGTHLIKLTSCLRPDIINILLTSVNKNKMTNVMNPISENFTYGLLYQHQRTVLKTLVV